VIESPAAPAPAPSAERSFSLSGGVSDTAFRELAGARVEVVDGPSAGRVATTDQWGHFNLPGTFTGTVQLMASKDGYQAQTKSYQLLGPLERYPPGSQIQGWVAFYLELPVPSANISGQYSFTLTADSACTGLPAEARTRTYTTTIAPDRPTGFLGRLSGARFLSLGNCPPLPDACTVNWFRLGTAVDDVGGYIMAIEQLSTTEYLIVSGVIDGSYRPQGITASLNGSLLHCSGEPYQIDIGEWWCPSGTASVQCDSTNHRLDLIRR
jgi:hypothetical protein